MARDLALEIVEHIDAISTTIRAQRLDELHDVTHCSARDYTMAKKTARERLTALEAATGVGGSGSGARRGTAAREGVYGGVGGSRESRWQRGLARRRRGRRWESGGVGASLGSVVGRARGQRVRRRRSRRMVETEAWSGLAGRELGMAGGRWLGCGSGRSWSASEELSSEVVGLSCHGEEELLEVEVGLGERAWSRGTRVGVDGIWGSRDGRSCWWWARLRMSDAGRRDLGQRQSTAGLGAWGSGRAWLRSEMEGFGEVGTSGIVRVIGDELSAWLGLGLGVDGRRVGCVIGGGDVGLDLKQGKYDGGAIGRGGWVYFGYRFF